MPRSKKKRITHVLILDESGSMDTKTVEVREMIENFVKETRDDRNSDLIQTLIIVSFGGDNRYRRNGRFTTLVNSRFLKDWKTSISSQYNPRGGTPLLDAIGRTIDEEIPANQFGVFISIITDGEENTSTKYSREDIANLIEEKKAEGWGITFSGVTARDLEVAERLLNVDSSNTYLYENTARGMKMSAGATRSARQLYSKSVVMSTTKDEIENTGLFKEVL